MRTGSVVPGSLSSYEEDEEEDFLAASWASQKTVCSDAFDFLFDSKNLNPETIKKEIENAQIVNNIPEGFGGTKNPNDHVVPGTKSTCCSIS